MDRRQDAAEDDGVIFAGVQVISVEILQCYGPELLFEYIPR